MVANKKQHGGGVIIFSILFAMILMLVPLPETVRFFRPEWVVMVLIYWAMALPRRVGVGFAWITGLFIDVIMGASLALFAFSYALVIYMVLRFHLQLRQYPLWQQALSIMSLVLLVQVINIAISPRTAGWHVWLPAVTSTLMWPFIFAILRKLRRTFHVN